jgi:hypothetical protein
MPGKGQRWQRAVMTRRKRRRRCSANSHDIYLNESACWRNVPAPVWDYTIGGYQVIKKWLSYREHELLGRPLTPDEAREVTHMARRIAALILLQPQAITFRASVLDCASPLALWSGQSNVRPCRMMRYVFCRNALT